MKSLSRLYPWRSLRGRIALVLIGLTLTLGVIALVLANSDLRGILHARLENRGIAIAKDLGRNSGNPALADDIFGLYELVNSSLVNNEDVRYIYLVEPSGDIRVHTFANGMPPGLKDANPLPEGEHQRVRTLRTTEGPILDIALAEPGGPVVHVGMSLTSIQREVISYVKRLAVLMAVGVVVAIALSVFLSSWLTRPLARLAQAAMAVGKGELSTKVAEGGGDEVSRVARAFNSMTEDLNRAQNELLARNADLEISNAMAENLSQLLTTAHVVDTSLERILELMAVRSGWVCLRDEVKGLTLAAHRGVTLATKGGEDSSSSPPCYCFLALETKQSTVMEGFPSCPLISSLDLCGNGAADPTDIIQHAMIPLAAHDEVLGVLVLVSDDKEAFGERRMRLLSSLGHQIGIALQNAYLYEAVQRQDAARRRLLEKLIRAQEEERRRVAREVHDEPTQALTGILMRLDRMERRLTTTGQYEQSEFEQTRHTLRQAIEVLQQITVDLRPRALDDLGFLPAIRWYSEQRLGDHDIQLDFQVSGSIRHLDPYAEVAIFRVTQEAVSNIIRHAGAKRVSMVFEFDGRMLRGTIEDDGRGFDINSVNPDTTGSGLGLLGMEERVSLLGGQFAVSSHKGEGTVVVFEIPLPEGETHGEEAREPNTSARS